MPVSFETYMQADSQGRDRHPTSANPFRQLVIEQMVRAKLVPASVADSSPTAAETGRFLSDQILTMHTQIVKDGSSNMNERRLSYQAVCGHLLTLLAVAGEIESSPE